MTYEIYLSLFFIVMFSGLFILCMAMYHLFYNNAKDTDSSDVK